MGLEPTLGSVDLLLTCDVEQTLGQSLGQIREILISPAETPSGCARSKPEEGPDIWAIIGPASNDILGPKSGPDIGPKAVFLPQSYV